MGEAEAEEEAARRYVRFARAAYRNAARTPVSVPPLPQHVRPPRAPPGCYARPCCGHGAATQTRNADHAAPRAPGASPTPEPCGGRLQTGGMPPSTPGRMKAAGSAAADA